MSSPYNLAAWRVSRALLLGVDRDSALALEFTRVERRFVGRELEGDELLALVSSADGSRVLVVSSGRSVSAKSLAVALETWERARNGWQCVSVPIAVDVEHMPGLIRSCLRLRDGVGAFSGDELLATTAGRRSAALSARQHPSTPPPSAQ